MKELTRTEKGINKGSEEYDARGGERERERESAAEPRPQRCLFFVSEGIDVSVRGEEDRDCPEGQDFLSSFPLPL